MLRESDERAEILVLRRAFVVLPFGTLEIILEVSEISGRWERFEFVSKSEVCLKVAGDDFHHRLPGLFAFLELGVNGRLESIAKVIAENQNLQRKLRLIPLCERFGILHAINKSKEQLEALALLLKRVHARQLLRRVLSLHREKPWLSFPPRLIEPDSLRVDVGVERFGIGTCAHGWMESGEPLQHRIACQRVGQSPERTRMIFGERDITIELPGAGERLAFGLPAFLDSES